MPVMSTSSLRATFTGARFGLLAWSEKSGRNVSTPCGERMTSQHGGGSTAGGHFCCVPRIHPRRCSTSESGELKSLLETMPVRSQNTCGDLNGSDAEMRSEASRRVRKSRGEQANKRHSKIPRTSALSIRMNADYCRERILTNCGRRRGRKGREVI